MFFIEIVRILKKLQYLDFGKALSLLSIMKQISTNLTI